ncbi:HTH domain-containing protein [Marinifilum sp. N1E240]|uniref:HTH domain-containing protein n=1 Tax=Marinifilum sp. N1E240 TaxID=2608082 RepID=UPI00128D401B|nr:HTH domain-containing protein [Marinifilum sp. N1E240]
MNYEEFLKRIIYLIELIEKERTGTPQELANKLHISVSSVYRTIKLLKQCGLQIEYSRIRGTYYFFESEASKLIKI